MKKHKIAEDAARKALNPGETLLHCCVQSPRNGLNMFILLVGSIFFTFCASALYKDGVYQIESGFTGSASISSVLIGFVGVILIGYAVHRIMQSRYKYCFVTDKRLGLRRRRMKGGFTGYDIKKEMIKDARYAPKSHDSVGIDTEEKTQHIVIVRKNNNECISLNLYGYAEKFIEVVNKLITKTGETQHV